MYAVELGLVMMGVRERHASTKKSIEGERCRGASDTRPKRVATSQSPPFTRCCDIHIDKMAEQDEMPVFFFDIDNCVSLVYAWTGDNEDTSRTCCMPSVVLSTS